MEEEKQPCKGDHYIDGQSPTLLDIQFDGRTCDCKKLIFFSQHCGCPGAGYFELKKQPNPDYVPNNE